MASTAELLIQIRADASAALAAFKATETGAKNIETATASAGSKGVSGFASMGEELQKVGTLAAGLVLGNLATNIGMGLAERFTSAAEEIDKYGQAVLKVQRITGDTAESSSILVAMFERYSGSLQQGTTSLIKFEQVLAGQEAATDIAAVGGKRASAYLEEFGISVNDATGHIRPMLDVLLDVADAFSKTDDATQKGGALQALFKVRGDAASGLLLMLNQGRAGLEAFAAAVVRYGLTLNQANLEDVQAFVFAHQDMDMALQGVALQLGATFMPAITKAAEATARFAQAVNQDIVPTLKVLQGLNLDGMSTALGVINDITAAVKDVGLAVTWVTDKLQSFQNVATALKPILDLLGGASSIIKTMVLGAVEPLLILVDLLRQLKMIGPDTALGDMAHPLEDAGTYAGDLIPAGPGVNAATAAKTAADEILKTLTDEADQRKLAFEGAQVDAETTLLQLKLDQFTADNDTLDIKRQIEDLDASAVDYTRKRLELDEQDAITRAKIAESALKNNADDLTFQQQLLVAQVKAARARGEHVDMASVRAQMKSMSREQIQNAPALLIAEHQVTLADRAKSATDLTTSLITTTFDRAKLALQELLRPFDAAAVVAKRAADDQAYTLNLAKQQNAIVEQTFAKAKLTAEAAAKTAELQLWVLQHPVGGSTAAATPFIGPMPVAMPDFEAQARHLAASGTLLDGTAPVWPVTVGAVHINVQGGDTSDKTLQAIQDSIVGWFQQAAVAASDQQTRVTPLLGGASH